MTLPGLLMTALLATVSHTDDNADWETYRNTLYPFQVAIPRGAFPEEVIYPRGDGRSYHSADGQAEVNAHGNLLDEEVFRCSAFDKLPDGAIETGNDGDVERSFIQGQQHGTAIHIMVVRTDSHCLQVDIRYPLADRERYEPLVPYIQDSLQALPDATDD